MIKLETCLALHYENETERDEIKRVISIARTVMSVTIPMPTLVATDSDGRFFISGTQQEISLLNTIFHNTLELENFNEAQDSVIAVSAEPSTAAFREPTTIVRPPFNPPFNSPFSPDEEDPFVIRRTPGYAEDTEPDDFEEDCDDEDAVRETIMSQQQPVMNIPFEQQPVAYPPFGPFPTYQVHQFSEEDNESQLFYAAIMRPSELDFDEPSIADRAAMATNERAITNAHSGDSEEWTALYNRYSETPAPTPSSTNSITIEQQVHYDALHNPRRWNLAKITYNGSRYYLSYLVPPCADINTEMRIRGGMHAEDHPDVQDILVWNTEPYWRELRHLIHQRASSLREAVPA